MIHIRSIQVCISSLCIHFPSILHSIFYYLYSVFHRIYFTNINHKWSITKEVDLSKKGSYRPTENKIEKFITDDSSLHPIWFSKYPHWKKSRGFRCYRHLDFHTKKCTFPILQKLLQN